MLKRARKSRISALINYFTNKSTRDVYQKPLDKILDLISEVTAEAKLSKTQVDGIIFAWKPSDAVTLRAFIDLYIENTVKIYEGIPSDHVTLTVAAMQADFLSPNYEPDFMPYVEVTRLVRVLFIFIASKNFCANKSAVVGNRQCWYLRSINSTKLYHNYTQTYHPYHRDRPPI